MTLTPLTPQIIPSCDWLEYALCCRFGWNSDALLCPSLFHGFPVYGGRGVYECPVICLFILVHTHSHTHTQDGELADHEEIFAEFIDVYWIIIGDCTFNRRYYGNNGKNFATEVG